MVRQGAVPEEAHPHRTIDELEFLIENVFSKIKSKNENHEGGVRYLVHDDAVLEEANPHRALDELDFLIESVFSKNNIKKC